MIKGRVVHGRGIGANLGYPTANVLPEEAPALELGVYAVNVFRGHERYHGLLVVGAIADMLPPSLEVHVLDFSGMLYGEELGFEVLEKVSELERCDSDEELLVKIEADIAKAREYYVGNKR